MLHGQLMDFNLLSRQRKFMSIRFSAATLNFHLIAGALTVSTKNGICK